MSNVTLIAEGHPAPVIIIRRIQGQVQIPHYTHIHTKINVSFTDPYGIVRTVATVVSRLGLDSTNVIKTHHTLGPARRYRSVCSRKWLGKA